MILEGHLQQVMYDEGLIGCDAVPEPTLHSLSHFVVVTVVRRLEKLGARAFVSVIEGHVAVHVLLHLAGTRRTIICNTYQRFLVFTLQTRAGVFGSAYARIQFIFLNSRPKVDARMHSKIPVLFSDLIFTKAADPENAAEPS